MKFFKSSADEATIYKKAFSLMAGEERKEIPSIDDLMYALAEMFSKETGEDVVYWTDENKLVSFSKVSDLEIALIKDRIESDERKSGWLDNKEVSFRRFGNDYHYYYIVIIYKDQNIKDRVEIEKLAATIFSAVGFGYREKISAEERNPLMLPEISYYRTRLIDFCGAAYIRPSGSVDIVKKGYGELMHLYRRWVKAFSNRDVFRLAFDAGCLVVLLIAKQSSYAEFMNVVINLSKSSENVDEDVIYAAVNHEERSITYEELAGIRLKALSTHGGNVK